MAKAKKTDDIDELEAELEGLEEIEEEAPDVEEEEDEDEDTPDLSKLTAAKLKEYGKGLGVKGLDKKNKAAMISLIEAHVAGGDEEEDEDDEEESDPLADLDRAALKALLKEHGLANAKKSESDDDLKERIRPELDDDEDEEEPDDEEEDEEEEEDEPDPLEGMSRAELKAFNNENDCGVKVLKSMSDDDLREAIAATMGSPAPEKAPANGKKTPPKGKQPSQLTRQLPTGKLGANDLAKMAGTSALNVRNFLRKPEVATVYPKNAELGRYAFTEAQAKKIVAAFKKAPGTRSK